MTTDHILRRQWLAAGAIALIATLEAGAEPNMDTGKNMDPNLAAITQMKDLGERELDSLLSKLSIERRKLQAELIHLLTSSEPKKTQQSAAYLLGLYRMEDAAQPLARLITLRGEPELRDRESLIAEFPAVEALVRIGNPSIPAVLRNLGESDDAKVRELSLKVIYHIEGDREIAQLRLRRAVEAQQDAKKKARLQAALQMLLEPKPE